MITPEPKSVCDLRAVAVDVDGDVFAVGGAENSSRMITVKYSPTGDELWVAEFDADNP